MVAYDFYENPLEASTFGFITRWIHRPALRAHVAGENVKRIFDHPYYQELNKTSFLYGPWFPVAPVASDKETIEMSIYWNMDCPKEYIWKIITDWTNASWVLGQPKTELIGEGPVNERIQVRKFSESFSIQVKMLSKNDSNFTVVENIVGLLKFPEVDFDNFYTTMSLHDHEGLDPQTQTRLRYHTRATVARGTYHEARHTLKEDFYGPRIVWYQKYFNCTDGIFTKRALQAVHDLHQVIKASHSAEELKAGISPFWTNSEVDRENLVTSSDEYFRSFNSLTGEPNFKMDIITPVELFVLPDYRVISVEDISSGSLLNTHFLSRIVIYQLNEYGKILSARLYDQSLTNPENNNAYARSIDHYFDILTLRDMERLRQLFVPDPVIEDPVGITPRTFDSVFTNFYTLQKDFKYSRSLAKTFTLGNQVAVVVDAWLLLPNGQSFKAAPIQIFTLNQKYLISHFEAFFRPKNIDFSKMK
jgi:hypothetical protein